MASEDEQSRDGLVGGDWVSMPCDKDSAVKPVRVNRVLTYFGQKRGKSIVEITLLPYLFGKWRPTAELSS